MKACIVCTTYGKRLLNEASKTSLDRRLRYNSETKVNLQIDKTNMNNHIAAYLTLASLFNDKLFPDITEIISKSNYIFRRITSVRK